MKSLIFLAVLAFSSVAFADFKPADIFADGMVLQRELSVPIWGTAGVGAKVEVSFAAQHTSATADQNGRWKLMLDPMQASAVGREMVFRSGDAVFTCRDVLVGEVWFAGGQSNMGYTCGSMAKHLPEGKKLVARARHTIRCDSAASVNRTPLSRSTVSSAEPGGMFAHRKSSCVIQR